MFTAVTEHDRVHAQAHANPAATTSESVHRVNSPVKKTGAARSTVPWLFGAVAFALSAKSLIGGTGDIGIYLEASREVGDLELDIYRARPDTGPWVYAPVVALPFQLLDQLFGDAGARWVWCAGMGVATALLLRALIAILDHLGGLRPLQWAAFGLLFQRILAQNCSHGQLSLWVGALIAMGVLSLIRRRDYVGGIWLGVASALKLTPGLFLPALPLMRRPAAAVVMGLTIALSVLVLPIVFWGWEEHVRQLQAFLASALQIFAEPRQAPIVVEYPGPSIRGTLDYLLQAREAGGIHVNVLDLGDGALAFTRLCYSAALGGVLLWWFRFAGRHAAARALIERAAVVTMAFTFFSPLTRTYHLSAILLPCAMFCRGPRSSRDLLWMFTATCFLLTQTLRQKNLIGETAWRLLDISCAHHVALLAMLAWLIRQSRRELPAPRNQA